MSAALVTSPHNPRVKALTGLRRRRERERSRQMLVEGHDELLLALASGARPIAVYYCPALVREPAELEVLERAGDLGAEIVELSEQVFARVAYRQGPDGWLAVFPAVPTALDRLRVGPDPLLLVCESVEKPGNLGAILRTADAAGVDAVISSPPLTDWANPNIIRASRGAIFAVQVAEAEPEALVGWLRDRDIAIVAASPGSALPFNAADLTGAVAIVLGAEHQGLSPAWFREADAEVRVPMFGRVNSLNVAASAALLVYEVLRQRGRLAEASG